MLILYQRNKIFKFDYFNQRIENKSLKDKNNR